MVTYLVTHNGVFHADEVLSSVILMCLFPDAIVVRTREQAWITPGAGKIIYDVGGDYNPEAQIFDHHQMPTPARDEEGGEYSSFGLIWKHFGRDYLAHLNVPDQDIEDIHASFDRSFVLPIDLLDNGAINPSASGMLSSLTLPALIDSLKPAFDTKEADAGNKAFHKAVELIGHFVEAAIAKKMSKRRAASMAADAVAAAGASRILELPMGMPFRSAIDDAEADHLLFVVTPRDTDWSVGTIRVSSDSFENRADLPASWAGLTNAELEAACGVKGAKFCHAKRFIAVAETREAALQMAQIAVDEVDALEPVV